MGCFGTCNLVACGSSSFLIFLNESDDKESDSALILSTFLILASRVSGATPAAFRFLVSCVGAFLKPVGNDVLCPNASGGGVTSFAAFRATAGDVSVCFGALVRRSFFVSLGLGFATLHRGCGYDCSLSRRFSGHRVGRKTALSLRGLH